MGERYEPKASKASKASSRRSLPIISEEYHEYQYVIDNLYVWCYMCVYFSIWDISYHLAHIDGGGAGNNEYFLAYKLCSNNKLMLPMKSA